MQKTTVLFAQRLNGLPDQSPGHHPVVQVTTDLPAGGNNTFYIDPLDLNNVPLVLAFDHPPKDPADPSEMNQNDIISFDVQDGLHKCVIWNNRKFRQRGYSFDTYQQRSHT